MSNNQNQGASIGAELLPCPFCGGPAHAGIYSGEPTIGCEECPAMMGGEESTATDEELRAAWNRRTPAAAVGAGELPPLPEAYFTRGRSYGVMLINSYDANQMRDYALAAIAADRAQRQAPVVREVPVKRHFNHDHVTKAWAYLRRNENTIPDDALDDMREVLRGSLATVTAPAQPADANWQYRVSAGPATGWSQWHPGRGDEFENSYKVERRRVTAAPAAPAASLQNWLNIIHDNELALGDRLQRISSHIQSILGGDAPDKYPPHTIREQCTCCAAPAAQQAAPAGLTEREAYIWSMGRSVGREEVKIPDERCAHCKRLPGDPEGMCDWMECPVGSVPAWSNEAPQKAVAQMDRAELQCEIFRLRSAASATAGMVEDAKDAPPCRNCAGFKWEPSIGGERRPCKFCQDGAKESGAMGDGGQS